MKTIIFILTTLLALFLTKDAFCQALLEENLNRFQREKEAMHLTELKYRHQNYLNAPLHENPTAGYLSLKANHAKERGIFKKYNYKYNVEFRLNSNQSYLSTSFREAYIERTFKRTTYGLGRKILLWHPNEHYWAYGTLNNTQGFSPLEPKQEGLTGFHMVHQKGRFSGELFASYFFVPQYNPSYNARNGKIMGRTEWASVIPTHFRFNNVLAPIFYQKAYPSNNEIIKELVLNESFALQGAYHYKRKKSSGRITAYGAYKPENHVRKYMYGIYQQRPKEQFVANIKAFANYHLLLGLGFYHQQGSWTLSGATEISRPEPGDLRFPSSNDRLRIHETYLSDMRYTSSLIYHSSLWKLGLHYINVQNKRKKNQRYFLDKIHEWNHALGFSLEYFSENRWRGTTNYKYDFRYKDIALKSEIEYTGWAPFQAALGLEIVESPQINSYWRPFTTNDSVYSYISYLF